MKITKSENIKPFDVDDTLVLPAAPGNVEAKHIDIIDPVTHKILKMRIHEPMVRLLEEEYHRGSYVIVWSRGGYEWATTVVRALGLEDKVHQVMSKPMTYFDDKEVSEWLTDRVYLSPDVHYKR